MAKENDDDILDDDNGGIPDQDDDLTAALRSEMEKVGDGSDSDDDDSGGFDAPLDEDAIEKRDTVDEEEGVKRIQEARDKVFEKPEVKKEDVKTPDAKAKDPDTTQKPEENEEVDPDPLSEGNDKAKPDAPELTDEAYDTAIGGLPDNVKARLSADRAAYDEVLAPFKGREDEMQRIGSTPKDAIARFVQLNDYAARDPAGYMAWVASESSGGDPEKAKAFLEKTAATMGYKVEKVEDNADADDPFMSDKERELTERVRLLEGETGQQQVGPDSPQEQMRRDQEQTRQEIVGFISESGADGQPLRPHFEKLQPMIVGLIKAETERTGAKVSTAGLQQAYDQAELAHPETREAALERLIASKSAAQGKEDVKQQVHKDAAATAKAKAASNQIIDVPGQGAEHQPVKEDANLGIEDFLRKRMLSS